MPMGATMLVLNQKVSYSLELCEEGFGHGMVRMRCIVDGRITQLGLGVRMEPVAHLMRARTRASASSPWTMATFPDLTSSRRARASCNQATCDADLGSKLAIKRSISFARSSGGRLRACAARSSTGMDMTNLGAASASMPQRACRCAHCAGAENVAGRRDGGLASELSTSVMCEAYVSHGATLRPEPVAPTHCAPSRSGHTNQPAHRLKPIRLPSSCALRTPLRRTTRSSPDTSPPPESPPSGSADPAARRRCRWPNRPPCRRC